MKKIFLASMVLCLAILVSSTLYAGTVNPYTYSLTFKVIQNDGSYSWDMFLMDSSEGTYDDSTAPFLYENSQGSLKPKNPVTVTLRAGELYHFHAAVHTNPSKPANYTFSSIDDENASVIGGQKGQTKTITRPGYFQGAQYNNWRRFIWSGDTDAFVNDGGKLYMGFEDLKNPDYDFNEPIIELINFILYDENGNQIPRNQYDMLGVSFNIDQDKGLLFELNAKGVPEPAIVISLLLVGSLYLIRKRHISL